MANLSEDIQFVNFDTRPPMLNRTDFASWQQRIRLYCWGKENGVNILKSINERPFQMGTIRETLDAGEDGALHLGPKRPRVYFDLSPKDKERYNADIQATNILLHWLPKDIYTLINHYTNAKDIWNNVKMLQEGSKLTKEDRESHLFVTAVKLNRELKESDYDQLYAYLKKHEAHANKNKMMLERFPQHTIDPLALMSNVSPHQYLSQSSTTLPSTHAPPVTYQPYFADNTKLDLRLSTTENLIKNLTNTLGLLTQLNKTYLPQTNNQLRTLLNIRNQAIVQDGKADECEAFDSNVDEAPTTQTMFMANLSFTDLDAVCENHEVHEMHDDVQLNCVVDSDAEYTGDSNMIPHDQYVKDNAEPVVQNNVSSVPNDACMMIINEMHEYTAQCVSVKAPTKVVDASLTVELATYKEQAELYERWAKFEFTKIEQKIREQLRIVIPDHNIKEENLKKKLNSVKMKLNSTINHNKSMVKEVASLKKDFKQKQIP
nr:hypothetical protein [Tanacetum cinerariifolium]